MAQHIGLDFGTSNSGAAVYDGRQVRLLPLDPLNVLPEVVKTALYITRDDRAFIGQEAVALYYKQNVNRLRRYVKKWVGEIEYRGADMFYVRDVYAYVDELQPGRLLQFLKTALRLGSGPAGYQGTQIFEKYYTITDLLRVYLEQIKQRAEQALQTPISAVTLGRPVHFSNDPQTDGQAQETLRQAALGAGFEQVDFELEPVAAALYYARQAARPATTLIFDFGGGTLDLAILRLEPNQRRVLASGGIGIAGSDFDRAIIQKRLLPHFGLGQVNNQPELLELVQAAADWMALPALSTPLARGHLERAIANGIAPVRLRALQALIFNDLAFSFYNQVERGKIALSSQPVTLVTLKAQDIDIWSLYTRSQFEKDIQPYKDQIAALVLETVKQAGLRPDQIDTVVKTGGSSGIPAFGEMLGQIFGPEKLVAANAFSSVTAGLAIKAFEQRTHQLPGYSV